MQQPKAVWPVVRWAIVAVVVGGGVWLLLKWLVHAPSPDDMPRNVHFSDWYGDWRAVHRGRGWLVNGGIYRHLRHPQYLGLILVVLAFNIQWPTLPTLLMASVLIVMYIRLARREDEELAAFFGEAFLDYAARTPGFLPWRKGARVLAH